MKKALAPSLYVDPPPALQRVFGDPPLIGGERPEVYVEFFRFIAYDAAPTDTIGWLLVKDAVDLSWEIQRERRIKASIIESKRSLAFRQYEFSLIRARCERELRYHESPDENEVNGEQEPQPVPMSEDNPAFLTAAYNDGSFDIDAIDRRIAFYEMRRNAVLREMERHSESLSRRTRDALEVLDGEFSEAE